MKKCSRCKIVFQDDTRHRCLYCDSLLLSATEEDQRAYQKPKGGIGGFKVSQPLVKQYLEERKIDESSHMQFVVGNYFRTRTLRFMYRFSKFDWRKGKGFKRFWIQPLNITSFLTLPWVVIDFFDSSISRFLYKGYDAEVDYKYIQTAARQPMSEEEKDYIREYMAIISEVLTGSIARNETYFKELAFQKRSRGMRSAYFDLCSSRNRLEWFLDVLCIWSSVLLISGLVAWLTLPKVMQFVYQLEI